MTNWNAATQLSFGPVMMDLEGIVLSVEEKELLKHPAIGGVIIFSRNYQSVSQITELNQAIRHIRPHNFLIAVDQEGGRVQRLRTGYFALPALHKLGMLFNKKPDQARKTASAHGYIMASELLASGFDISFAPILDLYNSVSKVIGDRALHAEPDSVIDLANHYIDGMQAAGMAATGKHFPGHGSIPEDSHLEIPRDKRSLSTLEQSDLLPFCELHSKVAGLMAAHIIYESIDTEMVGFSTVWLQQILRQKIGFEGAIISDDLSMEGASVKGDYPARVKAALNAGCDMVLICNNRKALLDTLQQVQFDEITSRTMRLKKLMRRAIPEWDNLHASQAWLNSVNLVNNIVAR